MKPFTTVAVPHRDILEKKLTMDIFAADLWDVFKGRAVAEYQDSSTFFRKTYVTKGLETLLEIARKRLRGEGGDPIMQLKTPFGGGKTHSLIALYHKAKEWGANVIVIDGSSLDPKDTLPWEELEFQLTGKIHYLKGKIPPGREKLRSFLIEHQPVLVLMDEIHAYTIKASGIRVEESTLASQVLVFMQELTGTIKTLDKSLLIVTLPSSALEHYDEHEDRLFQQLQKIFGRIEKIHTPVQDSEISNIVRSRLFSSINEEEARKIIEEFLDYAEKEGFLPEGVDRPVYRERFLRHYPFQPEVLETLYTRWGTFKTFQRTRGVLRLLSLVVYSLRDSRKSYIRLSDFNLDNDEIKEELTNHIGQEFDSVLAADITSENSGAKKVDRTLGGIYTTFSFGTKAATAIFMYSHSIGLENGATIDEIKLSSAEITHPSSIIAEAVSRLRENLFYLQSNGRSFFTSQPNLNRILLNKMEGVSDENLTREEWGFLTENVSKKYFEIYLWPKDSKEISDTKRLKLIILRNKDEELCKNFSETSGTFPRVNRNSLTFLCPLDSERVGFEDLLRRKCAWESIEEDKTLNLAEEQEKRAKKESKSTRNEVTEAIRNLYRVVLLPSKDRFEEIDLGHPTYGTDESVDKRVYEILKEEGKINEKLAPLIIREKYLREVDYVRTKNIFESFSTTPGEIRITSEDVLKTCIRNGVKEGLFGAGDLENEKPKCHYYRIDFSPELVEGEILVKVDLCKRKGISDEYFSPFLSGILQAETVEKLNRTVQEIPWENLSLEQEEKLESEIERRKRELSHESKPTSEPVSFPVKNYHDIKLKLKVPSGKLSDIVRMVTYIKQKFEQVNVSISISTEEGEISVSDYEDKIKEAIQQAEVIIEEEDVR